MTDRRLTPEADDHHAVVDIVRGSGVYRVLAGMLAVVLRAAQTSAGAAATVKTREAWKAASAAARARAVGAMLATASIVHVAVNASFGDTVGRFWLAIPTAMLVASVLLVAIARDAGTTRKTF